MMEEIEKHVDSLSAKKRMGSRKRRLSLMLVFVLVIAVAVSADTFLLDSYGTIETHADVEQAVLIDGGDYTQQIVHEFEVVGGCTKMVKHKILNQACIEAEIEFFTESNDATDINYYTLPGWSHLLLENKNPATWEIIDDEYWADFWWNPCCPLFEWELEVHFIPDTDYTLVYYADQPDRFEAWGGAPALMITQFTTDQNGYWTGTGSQNLGCCLPYATDWNIGPYADYTQPPDNYVHGKGAKLWIVPTYTYDGVDHELTTWAPNEMLFETDLIIYCDCDINPMPEYIYPYFEYECPVTGAILQPGEEICFFIEYVFAINTMPYLGVFYTDVIPIVD